MFELCMPFLRMGMVNGLLQIPVISERQLRPPVIHHHFGTQRRRMSSIARTSGLSTLADTGAIWVLACAGFVPPTTLARKRTAMMLERADGRTTTSLDRAEWLNPAGYSRNG